MEQLFQLWGAVQPAILALVFAGITLTAGGQSGFKTAQLQENWACYSSKKRWFDVAIIAMTLLFSLAALSLLGLVREWAAVAVKASKNGSEVQSAQLVIPFTVAAAYMVVACLGLILSTIFSFWNAQGRVHKILARDALKQADKELQKGLKTRWTSIAKKRDMLLAAQAAQQEIIRSEAFKQIHEYNYGTVDTNTAGKALHADFLVAPDERLIPKRPLAPMCGSFPEELSKWLAVSIVTSKQPLKSVK